MKNTQGSETAPPQVPARFTPDRVLCAHRGTLHPCPEHLWEGAAPGCDGEGKGKSIHECICSTFAFWPNLWNFRCRGEADPGGVCWSPLLAPPLPITVSSGRAGCQPQKLSPQCSSTEVRPTDLSMAFLRFPSARFNPDMGLSLWTWLALLWGHCWHTACVPHRVMARGCHPVVVLWSEEKRQ